MQEIFDKADIHPETCEESDKDHSSRAGRIYAHTGGVSEAVQKTVEQLSPHRKITIKPRQADGVPACRAMIEEIVREVEVGKIYEATVVKVEDFGCFVQIWPGCEGMVHISELNTERVEKVTDIVKEGDEIIVKCLGYDKRGRLNFSRKEAIK